MKIVRWLMTTMRRMRLLPEPPTSELAEHIKAFNRSRIYTPEL
jgi:hypothetical protein